MAEYAGRPHTGAVLPKTAELEWSALQRQCLGQRLASREAVERELLAWTTDRNRRSVRVNWQFSTPAARQTLKRHYPAHE